MAHRSNADLFTLRPDEGALHWDPRAKYTVAFFKMSRSSVTLASSRFSHRFSASWSMMFALNAVSLSSFIICKKNAC